MQYFETLNICIHELRFLYKPVLRLKVWNNHTHQNVKCKTLTIHFFLKV